jgi:pilus assembly protein Flp/PilA
MIRADDSLHDRHSGFATRLASIGHNDRGATAVEYSLIVVLIAAVIVAIVALLGTHVSADFASLIGKF